MRLANDFKVSSDALATLIHLGHHVVCWIFNASLGSLICINIDIEDDLFEDFVLLAILIHSNELLKNVFWDFLISKLASNDGCAEVRNEFVFQIFLNKEGVDLREQILALLDLQAELY